MLMYRYALLSTMLTTSLWSQVNSGSDVGVLLNSLVSKFFKYIDVWYDNSM